MATGVLGGDDDWVEIESQRLDVVGAHDYLADATGRWGATVVFLGRVRRFTDPSHTGFFPAGVVLSGGPAVVETQVVETQVVETQVVETQVVETQVVETQVVETQVVETLALHYECYPEMAVRALRGLLAECRQRWSLGRLVVQHRVGRLAAGEVAILIGVSSSHRAAAYAANEYLIDEIKRRVPVWKQEIYPSGATTWVHPRPDRVQ